MQPTDLISADRALALLRELEAHPVSAPGLLTHVPLTAERLAELTDAEKAERSAAALIAVRTTPGLEHALDLVVELGRARFALAVELLGRLWRHSVVTLMRTAAGHALFEIGTAEAHASLQSALHDVEPGGCISAFLAIKSIVAAAPESAFDTLSPYFEDTSMTARLVAGEALEFFGPKAFTRDGPTSALPLVPALLRSDRRWVQTALRFRRDAQLGGYARALLGSLTAAEIDAALAEYPDPPAPPRSIYVGPRDLLARYMRGEHDDVWHRLRAAGDRVEPALREEALAVATAAMRRVRANVECITERLRGGDYPFDGACAPWAAPAASTDADIARIEQAVGGPVPITLRAFWTAVGSVFWMYTEDEDVGGVWRGLPLREADPLCVDDAASTWGCIEEWQENVASSHIEAVGPALLALAPDHLHKANISGGMPYGFWVPNGEVDAIFEWETHALPFVEYLRLCFRWGGFPRLEGAEIGSEARRTLETLRRGMLEF